MDQTTKKIHAAFQKLIAQAGGDPEAMTNEQVQAYAAEVERIHNAGRCLDGMAAARDQVNAAFHAVLRASKDPCLTGYDYRRLLQAERLVDQAREQVMAAEGALRQAFRVLETEA